MTPTLGAARSGHGCQKTFDVLMAGIDRVHPKGSGERLLDIGCGTGYFTIPLGRRFREIHGVDVNADNVSAFGTCAPSNYTAHLVNAAQLPFPGEYFDAIVTIETLEHVADLPGVAREAARVLRRGGELLITVPNRWSPVEGHGGTIFGKHYARLPLVTWFPWLHARVGDARVFTARSLDQIFAPLGFRRCAVAYLWPTFEHGGGGGFHRFIQKVTKPLLPLMRRMEKSPLRLFGCSVVVRYEKVK